MRLRATATAPCALAAPCRPRGPLLTARVDEPAHAVGEEHVDLPGLDHRRHLAHPEDRVRHGLARAVRVTAVVRGSGSRRRARRRLTAGLEPAARAALRAAHARDAPRLRHRRHDVAALLAAHRADLLHALPALMNLFAHTSLP